MAFDQEQDPSEPLVHPERRTTKVNIGIVISVILFVCLGLLAMFMVRRDPPAEPPEVVPEVAPIP